MEIKNKKYIYHLTHIKNLDSIMENGLLSRNNARRLDGTFLDVANPEILEQRSINNLGDYVLFHFHPYSAFDVAVKAEYGAEDFVYICVDRSTAKRKNFKIIPRHPLNGDFEIYDYDEGFENIDWDLLETNMNDIPENKKNEAKLSKMAECVCSETVSSENFSCIYCHGSRVDELQKKYKHICYVNSGVWLNND